MFDERKHPRDADGKFTDGNSGNDRADKLATAVKKYSDTPKEDLESMGIGKPSLSDFITRVKNGKTKHGETFELGEITERARKDIERLTGQKLNATKHVISADEIKHIEKGHGEQGRSDHSMSSIRDYEQIADVLSHYNNVDWAHKKNGDIDTTNAYLDREGKPARLIKFTKQYPNNEQYAIEAVSDTKGKLHIISSYKKGTDSK